MDVDKEGEIRRELSCEERLNVIKAIAGLLTDDPTVITKTADKVIPEDDALN